MHVPQRAQPAEPREPNTSRAKSLRDVPGDVDAQHVERDALGPGSMQCGETMTRLLPPDPESVTQQLDVVPLDLGGAKEGFVRHEYRASEIAGERDAGEGSGFVARELRVDRELVERRRAAEECRLHGELAVARAAAQHLRELELASRDIEASYGTAHLTDRHDADAHAVGALEVTR